jgi:signal transduction histidine kinase
VLAITTRDGVIFSNRFIVKRARKQRQSAAPSNQKLARKVHDDISQRVTMLGIELALLEAKPPKANAIAPKIQQLSKLTSEIALAVREVMEALSAKSK